MPDAANFDITMPAVTIDAWISPSGCPRPTCAILTKSDLHGAAQRSYGLWLSGPGGVAPAGGLHVEGSGFGSAYAYTAGGIVPNGVFTHVAAVITPGVGFALYVNGVAQAVQGSGTPTLVASTVPVTIGASDLGGAPGDYFFEGLIDEVEIFNRALTPSEIAALYEAGGAGKCKAPDSELIFADAVESNDFSAWSSATTDAGDLTTRGADPLQGSFDICATVDDLSPLFLQDDSPNAEPRYRARFLVDTDEFDPGEAQNHRRMRLLIGFTETPQRRLFAIVLRRIGGPYGLILRTRRDDNVQLDAGPFDITPGVHSVQIDWQRASGPGAADGRVDVWIDETLAGSITGIDNDTAFIDFVRWGALSVKGGAMGNLYFDKCESRRVRYILP